MANDRIEARKTRDRDARRAQIIRAARRIAEEEGWPSVTVRRLSHEIAYSQPVLYSHFDNREGIVAAVAIEGFQELGTALQRGRQNARRTNPVEAVSKAYLDFAAASPALYEAMFTLGLTVPFGAASTPPELRFAFSQMFVLFEDQGANAEAITELFWASLHGLVDLGRTGRQPPSRRRQRLSNLVAMFSLVRASASPA